MRGVAVLAVIFYHLHGVLTHDGKTALFGPVLDWLCEQGYLGVEVFFVLSGFVITHALRPLRLSPAVAGKFMLRRFVRLAPTYWVILFLTFAANAILVYRGVIDRPPVSAGTVLANMFFLQEILSVYAPVSVAGPLCAELQFYLLFVVLLWAFQWLRELAPRRLARLIVFAPAAIASLLVAGGHGPQLRGIYLDHWHLFFLGTAVYWSLMGLVSSIWFWIYLIFAIVLCNGSILGGVGCALAIGAFARLGLLDSTVPGRILPYLGSRSYSLFAVHVLVGSNLARVLLRLNWVPETFLVLLLFFAIALAASIVAAEILYRLIEWPTHRLSRKIALASPTTEADLVRGTADVLPALPQFAPPTAGGLLGNYLSGAGQKSSRRFAPSTVGFFRSACSRRFGCWSFTSSRG